MRLATYIGLVVRRVWAKKGILVGSLLGATLVIALLVVVPLYEASVRAVDLRFTVEGAPADEVDITAFSTLNRYDATTAAFNRRVLDDNQERWITAWYPSSEERTQTREYSVIPTGAGAGVDWFGAAEIWQAEIERLAASEVPRDEWPGPPYPQPPREATQVRILTAPDLRDRLEIISGEYASALLGVPPEGATSPLPIMLGAEVARLTGFGPGDTFLIKPFTGLPSVFEFVEVAGVVTAADPNATIWGLDDPEKMVYLDQQTFDVWTGALPIPSDEDPWLRPTRGLQGPSSTQRWRMGLARDTVRLEEVELLGSSISQFRAEVNKEAGGAIPVATFFGTLVDEFNTRSVVIGGPILAMLALVVGGAVYFLVYTSALTVEREGSDIALLKSRGASSWQTTGIHLGQSFLVAATAAALAPFVARFLVAGTGRVPPLSELTGGEPLEVSQVQSVIPWLLAGGIVTFFAMGVAILPFARRGVLALRSLVARPGTKSVWQRYNLDLFAIAISFIVMVQLVQRGFVNTTGDEVTLDPLAIVFPVLLLFTGALVLLRIFPYLLKLVGWGMTKFRPLAISLPGWHLGRNPIPYGRLALLVWVTTGLGAFALTYAATLEASFDDRAAFAAGSDVRMVAAGVGYAEVPNGAVGSPVLRTEGAPRQSGRRAEVLAVIPGSFADVVAWRTDFGASDPHEVFAPLRPDGLAPDVGIELPATAAALALDGVVVPVSLAEQEELGDGDPSRDHRLLVKVIDGRTRVWTMVADVDFTDEGWSTATIDLSRGENVVYGSPPEPPLVLHAIWVERPDPAGGLVVNGDSLLVRDLRVIGVDGGTSSLDTSEMTTVNGLQVRVGVPADLAARELYSAMPPGVEPPAESAIAASPLTRAGTATMWTLPQRSRSTPTVPQLRRIPDPIRVLLDHEAAAISSLVVGDTSSYSVGPQVMEGELVGLVGRVPTMTDPRQEGRMIVDLDAINAWTNGAATWSLTGTLSRSETPDELWVATESVDATVRRVTGQLGEEPDQVVSVEQVTASFSSRPVQVGLVSILFVGALTGVVLALAGVTGYVLLAVSRRAREMGVLRALGFGRRGVGSTFAVEQLVVIGLGAFIGVLGGIALVIVMVPFLQLGETAEAIEPPIVLTVPWPQLLAYVALIGVLLIVSVVWATRRVSVRKMSEVLREVER